MQRQHLNKALSSALNVLEKTNLSHTYALSLQETGTVRSIASGIVKISGLPEVGFEELIRFPGDIYGIALNIDEDEVGVALLGDDSKVNAGDEVERTGRVMDIPVGNGLLGRVINSLGKALDEKGNILSGERLPIERPAPAIMDRAPVNVPLQTGTKIIDALIPVGRGQRELILGDRQTGKTTIAIDAIINQKGKDVICIYCAIGQRAASVAKVIANLKQKNALEYTVVMVTEGNDSPGMQFIAPYAATSIGEYFMSKGKDVLLVYDDLTQHARAYRELSLLLRRPPGREAFPGDIFYVHSRLLERSTHLSEDCGGGSLTSLPIIETEAQNISAYIPTNLISITDGQIYLSPKLFELGVLPAIDIGMSVSRVGGKAQLPVYRKFAGNLKLAFAQFEELESFSRFGTRLDKQTQSAIEYGKRIREVFKQKELSPLEVEAQIITLLCLTNHLFDEIPLEKVSESVRALEKGGAQLPGEMIKKIRTGAKLDESEISDLLGHCRDFLAHFQSPSKS
jgi:F-type H+-transporting ATPase subunit alpha